MRLSLPAVKFLSAKVAAAGRITIVTNRTAIVMLAADAMTGMTIMAITATAITAIGAATAAPADMMVIAGTKRTAEAEIAGMAITTLTAITDADEENADLIAAETTAVTAIVMPIAGTATAGIATMDTMAGTDAAASDITASVIAGITANVTPIRIIAAANIVTISAAGTVRTADIRDTASAVGLALIGDMVNMVSARVATITSAARLISIAPSVTAVRP